MDDMTKSQNICLVRYEYIAYIHLLKTFNVNEILLTMDDFVDIKSQSDQIKWIPVENMDIDIIDIYGEIEVGCEDPTTHTRNRICGLFDAEPLDWKYARIMVGDDSNTKHNYAIAKIPRSPIVPVIFDVNERLNVK